MQKSRCWKSIRLIGMFLLLQWLSFCLRFGYEGYCSIRKHNLYMLGFDEKRVKAGFPTGVSLVVSLRDSQLVENPEETGSPTRANLDVSGDW
jgi:hypothetical protein